MIVDWKKWNNMHRWGRLKRFTCRVGFHKWEIENLGEGTVRVCPVCDKEQYWYSAGFPAYFGEWRNP
jgi:hypothetical protein